MRQALRRPESVAVAREHHLAARQRTGSHVEDTVAEMVLARLGSAEVPRPIPGPHVGSELLVSEPDDLPRLDVDFEDIGPGGGTLRCGTPREIVEKRIIDPGSVKGNHRIGHRTSAASHQDFFTAIRT